MKTRECAVCGAEFAPATPNRKFCSAKCRAAAKYRRSSYRHRHDSDQVMKQDFFEAWQCGLLKDNDAIMRANCKPTGVSDIRWRIELRRRLNPDRYAMA